MADTSTPNYNFVKPEISGSPDTWGNKLNANFDIVDAQLKAVDDAKLALAGGTVTGAIKYAADPVAGDELARKSYVDGIVTGTGPSIQQMIDNTIKAYLPIGSIIMWGGTLPSIPVGWGLCDGTVQAGVQKPNLADRFIIGAHPGLTPGGTGGAGTHSHSLGATALDISQIPSHAHSVYDPGHAHGISDPGHSHSYSRPVNTGPNGMPGYYNDASFVQDQGGNVSASGTGISIQGAGTGIAIYANGGSQAHAHSLSVGVNTPPYYALAYIMRVQ